MGQEIFYCGGCKNLLRSRDLEKGDAVRSGDQVYCSDCAPKFAAAVEAPPPAAPKPLPNETPRRTPAVAGSRTPRTPHGPVPEPKSPTPLVAAGAGGVLLLIIVIAVASSGSSSKPPPKKETPVVETPPEAPKPTPLPPPLREPRPDPRPPTRPADREASARRLLEEAKTRPAEDVDGRLERARLALLEAEGTPAAEEARRFEAEARTAVKERDDRKRAELETRVKDALAAERFGEAIGLLEAAKADARVAEVRATAAAAWKDVADKLTAARRRGADADIKALTARVEAWGIATLKEELAKALAQPVAVEPPAELLAYRKRWSEPWALSTPFDYAAAIKELEKGAPGAAKAEAAADLEAVRLAAEVAREAPPLLQKAAKGQELRIERFEEGWTRAEVAGKLLRVGPGEVLLWTGEEATAVALAELTPAAWAELFRGRAAKKPTDARACQIYCLLEGDAEGAARFAGDVVPPGPAGLAARVAVDLRSPAETEARKAFAEAEKAFHGGLARLGSGALYAALGKSTTSFARRAKPLLDERAQESQEVFLGADELTAAGLFMASEALKGASCVTMSGEGRAGESYVQVELPVAGAEVPRCWVYAGGCCLEVLAFGVQAPELSGPNPRDPKETVVFEPGSAFALPAKVTASLKAKHAQHLGPKEASKWAWVSIPLPKYSTPGVRKIRLVAEQPGFSIAYLWAGIGRPGPPRELDVKEFEKARAELDALRVTAPVQTGSLLREWWSNVPGSKVAELQAAPGFPDRPSGSDRILLFEGPTNFGDNYGTRVRGYLHPPLTGNYVFTVCSDDDSELWISSDESPARRRKIAGVVGATGARDWDHALAGKSAPVPLKAGKRYYVELLQKEGAGGDQFAVGWLLPDGSIERPIPGNRLSPWAPKPPRTGGFVRAINFNGPSVVIDGRTWEGKDAPQVTIAGESFDNQNVPLEPAVDGPKAQMLRSSIFNRGGLTLSIQIPNGRYQVFAYIWEDNANQVFDILLQGKVVREKYNSGGAGHWERVGPLAAEVVDGKLELRTTPGDANLSGLEIWRAR